MSRVLPRVHRLVVKIGSAVLAPDGQLERANVRRLADELARVHATGVQITIVSSGAVASGFRALGLESPPKAIAQKQAAAAVGQPRLMAAWQEAFARHDIATAQALYTGEDLQSRHRFLNTRRTLAELLDRRVIPIVNENDTTSFDEIKLGDNDRLSALTADLVAADLLLILSTAHGLYRAGTRSEVIPSVSARELIEAERHIRPEKSATGVGGMTTKLSAAGYASSWGIPTIVAGGAIDDVVSRVLAGEVVGTLFEARPRRTAAKKRWLHAAARAAGVIIVDDGAARAITQRNASLLPGGIVKIEGDFDAGAPVEVRDRAGTALARGVTSYSSADLTLIRGKRSSQIQSILGSCYSEEAIHRNDLMMLG